MEGTRSLSDLARTAMQKAVNNAGAGQNSESARLARLEGLVAELSSCVEVLRGIIYDQSEIQMLDPKPAVSLGGRANAKSA
jgi:hypothetical protein